MKKRKYKMHLQMNAEMLEKLVRIGKRQKKPLSWEINTLLKRVFPLLRTRNIKEGRNSFPYAHVGNVKDLSIYLDPELYQTLRKIKWEWDYFSKAQVVRDACQLYLDLQESIPLKVGKLIKS